jgi:hypothetical protein
MRATHAVELRRSHGSSGHPGSNAYRLADPPSRGDRVSRAGTVRMLDFPRKRRSRNNPEVNSGGRTQFRHSSGEAREPHQLRVGISRLRRSEERVEGVRRVRRKRYVVRATCQVHQRLVAGGEEPIGNSFRSGVRARRYSPIQLGEGQTRQGDSLAVGAAHWPLAWLRRGHDLQLQDGSPSRWDELVLNDCLLWRSPPIVTALALRRYEKFDTAVRHPFGAHTLSRRGKSVTQHIGLHLGLR